MTDTGIQITYKQLLIGLLVVIGVVILALIIRGIVRAIRRKVRSLTSMINTFASAAVTKGVTQSIQKLDDYEKSKVTPVNQKEEVRTALREQMPVCPQCGAPNKSIEEFCEFCGASLIRGNSK